MAPETIQGLLEGILTNYQNARKHEAFGKKHPMWKAFTNIKALIESSVVVKKYSQIKIDWSIGQGNWAKVPWIAFLDQRETKTTQNGIYGVFLFREDMSGVYLTFNQGVTEPKNQLGATKGRKHLSKQAHLLRKKYADLSSAGYLLDNNIDLRVRSGLGVDYESSTIAYKFYATGSIPPDQKILNDIQVLLDVYDNYVLTKEQNYQEEWVVPAVTNSANENQNSFVPDMKQLINNILAQGYVYEPWQIATYVVALRTKPFIILAGVTGTGKSKLPVLVGQATGGKVQLISVRPDWTDSADILGYSDLQGNFRPGPLLEFAREAAANSQRHYVCLIDEMNLARVEHYFAEILSRLEDREPNPTGGYKSGPLLVQRLRNEEEYWSQLGLPPNLALVGTVNMDESTHGFSRKVLDRAFTIELSEVDLSIWQAATTTKETGINWPVAAWYPRGIRLGQLNVLSTAERQQIENVIKMLIDVNKFLTQAQYQVGYRTRDEIALFVLHANELLDSFVTRTGEKVDPLDLALQMKILPRISGGSTTIRRILLQLLGWTYKRQAFHYEEEAVELIQQWEAEGFPAYIRDAQFPRTTARLCLMWDRMINEGFTSYWL